MISAAARKIATVGAFLGLAIVAMTFAPTPAKAWWHHGYGWGVGVFFPPVVVTPPPPAYYPPAAYYPPPARAWIPAHWENGYWIPGHWA
jgi:hypothetical protein